MMQFNVTWDAKNDEMHEKSDEYESVTVFFEPTDRRKAIKAFHGNHEIAFASPNIIELRAIAKFLKPNHFVITTGGLEEITELCKITSKFIKVQIITRGDKGVVIFKKTRNNKDNACEELEAHLYSCDIVTNVENVSGAGDCFASGFIHGLLLGLTESACVANGFNAAKAALLSKSTVPSDLSAHKFG